MNKNIIITIIFAVIFGIANLILLRYEDLKQQKTVKEADGEAEKESFWRFPTWMYIYGIIMLIVQIGMSCVLCNIYHDHTLMTNIRRIGLLTIIWQAAVTDWKYNIIPNDFVIEGAAFWIFVVIIEFFTERQYYLVNLISGGIAFLGVVFLVLICLLFMKNSIGMGDLKLLMVMSVCQGTSGFMASGFCSLLVSFFWAIILLIKKKKTRKDTIPFAPCLLLGTLVSVFMTGI